MNIEQIGTGIIYILTLIGTMYNAYITAKNKAHIKNVPNEIKISTTHNTKIQNKLIELKEIVNADRVLVYDFHNGEHYSNGRGATKVSATFESTKPNVKSISLSWLNIPLSLFNSRMDTVIKNGNHYVKNIEELNNEVYGNSYQAKLKDEVKSFYDYAIMNKYQEAIGFVEVQYTNDYHTMTECEIKELEKTSYIISDILEEIRKEQN